MMKAEEGLARIKLVWKLSRDGVVALSDRPSSSEVELVAKERQARDRREIVVELCFDAPSEQLRQAVRAPAPRAGRHDRYATIAAISPSTSPAPTA